MTEIKWEDPAPDPRSRGKYRDLIRALRNNPGQWALVSEDAATTLSSAIKKGLGQWAPAGDFESVSRSLEGGQGNRVKVYARYIGGEPR